MEATDGTIRDVLKEVTDMQLIMIIANAEDWTIEQVYKTAHTQVHVEGDPWEKFNKSMEPGGGGQLPTPVRQELQRAFKLHMDAKTLQLPKPGESLLGGSLTRYVSNLPLGKWFMIGWAIYFIMIILF
jgi:hypothetical protein